MLAVVALLMMSDTAWEVHTHRIGVNVTFLVVVD